MEKIWKDLSVNLKQDPSANLVQTSNAGRGLVATINLEKDDIIFEESPLIIGPPQSLGPSFCANCSLSDLLLPGKIHFLRLLCDTAIELCLRTVTK